MRKIVGLACILFVCGNPAFAQNNRVIFDNQSGEPALVKLIGPTKAEVEVADGAKAGADAFAGRHTIKVRYGTPGKYHYTKGDEFEVKETATAKSEVTITLHKVVAGNYDSRPITEADFGTPLPTGEQRKPSQWPQAKSTDGKINGVILTSEPPRITNKEEFSDAQAELALQLYISSGKLKPEWGIYDKHPDDGGQLMAVGYGKTIGENTVAIYRRGEWGIGGPFFQHGFNYTKGGVYRVESVKSGKGHNEVLLSLLGPAEQQVISKRELTLGNPAKRVYEVHHTAPSVLWKAESPEPANIEVAASLFVEDRILKPEWGLYEIGKEADIGELIIAGKRVNNGAIIRYGILGEIRGLQPGPYESDGKGNVKTVPK